jgi:hypothetical protein
MATFQVDKVVSALPGTLTANTMYAVRVGAGFDFYLSDSTGSVAHKVNGPATTDAVPEGTSNLYHTAARVRAVVITGLSTATNAAITATDTILTALGKLQAQITGHFGVGGSTHPDATTGVSGFMSSTDKTKLNGVATGATANSTDAALLSRANHTGTQLASTVSDFSTAVAATAAVTANTAKVSNATHTGEVTGATALTITANAVTNAKLAQMTQSTLKGRAAAAGTGDPADLTAAQARTLLEVVKIHVGTTAPTSPATGDLWVDTN